EPRADHLLRRTPARPELRFRHAGDDAGGDPRLRPPLRPAALPCGRGCGGGGALRRADRLRPAHPLGQLRADDPHRIAGEDLDGRGGDGDRLAGAGAAGRRAPRLGPCGGADAEPQQAGPRGGEAALHGPPCRGRGQGAGRAGDGVPEAL
ncbi:MAG: Acyl dehydratase, partial [uncultured Craurococcus sp.]